MKSSSTGKVATRKASDIDEIIIHCSATPAGKNYTSIGMCYVGEPHTDVNPARPGVLRRGKLSAPT